jgi:glycosyltransferase involved in cell wall biosynthesis
VATEPRPRVLYVSYDGAAEPLGQSQVVPYLSRLSGSYDITLISFEKTGQPSPAVRRQLTATGVSWLPLRYHGRPPVISTAQDVAAGVRILARTARGHPPAIVHVRSYVPALVALLARRFTRARLLFDIRGFWADERVEGSIWRAGGMLYRVAKRFERRFFAEADAIVTLTEASLPQIRQWVGDRAVPIEVIPTCVDLHRFGERPPRPDGPHAVWVGSIGTWYRFDLVRPVATALGIPLTVLTRQEEMARHALSGYPAAIASVEPDAVPHRLHARDIGLCLITSSFSKTASAPTRFGEYLAVGMPVLVTRGVGDLEQIVTTRRIGVVLEGEDEVSIAEAARRLRALATEPGMPERCRAVARELFDVDAGAARYAELYRRLLSG